MAEDQDNVQKPKVILNKQTKKKVAKEDIQIKDDEDNKSERKKVVVVKKRPVVVVKSSSPVDAALVSDTKSDLGIAENRTTRDESNEKSDVGIQKDENQAMSQPNISKTQQKQREPFELSPQRPNVKVGNLADKPRQPRSNQGNYPPRDGGGYQQRRDNFTGAQARQGARDTTGYQGGQRGPGQGQGGYQGGQRGQGQGGYQGGQRGPGQGGYQGGQRGSGGYQGGQRGPGQGPGGYQGGQRGPGGYQGGQRSPGGYQGGQRSPGGANRPGGFGRSPSPAPLPTEGRGVQVQKKSFKGKKTVYTKKTKEEDLEYKLYLQKKKALDKVNAVPKEIEIMESISISELARKMNLKASDLIGKLMSMGMMVTVNQSIDSDTATLLASEYDCTVHIVSLYDETVIESQSDENVELLPRSPVVTIMGHVDHGKTKTLDAIRSANVAAGEFGGITQHIGAYSVKTQKGTITFLDTPGHEAFTMMRARGAEITDLVVLVVAADDGVMPQTIEAINHAKDAKVPIIVAVNKIDKHEANPDKVMTQLSDHGLVPEDWGGDTMYVKISALKKEGIDELLDSILLHSELLELTANYECRAEGKVIESRIDHGRGIVATIIVERGTLRTGDAYVAGVFSGRVRAIFNDRGEKVEEATPSMPVEILGLEGMPNAGDPFQVTENERIARQISSKRQELKRFEDSRNVKKVTLDNLYDTISDGEILELKVIIKGDVQGSVEALKQSLEKLSTKDIRLNVIHASAGAINDSDVMLAAADSNALIIGFNVRPTLQAKLLADQEKVDIRKYNVIYKAVEEIELAMEGMLKPDVKEEVIGMVEVREVIKVPKIGAIAGSYVLQGIIKRSSLVNVIREGIVVHSGKLASLRRFKDDVKEVASGFECGIGLEKYHDIKVGDQIEVIELVEIARKLKDSERLDKTSDKE